jgi:hypothetical protein
MSKRFYTKNKTTEPDMRQEFHNTMDGFNPEISKAQTVVLRKMKRSLTDPIITDKNDPNYDPELIKKFHARGQITDYYVPGQGYLQFCPCTNKLTGESDLDYWCPICQGDSFIWEESFIDAYKVQLTSDVGKAVNNERMKPGHINIQLVSFYVRHNVPITKADKIVEVWTDIEGKPIRPYTRESIFRIVTPIDYRSDNGKLEYWKLDCHEEQRKFLNGPKVG